MKTTKKWGKMLLVAMFGMVLTLGLMVVGCDTGGGGDKDSYKLTWGIWVPETYSTVSGYFTVASAPLTAAGSNAGYITGSTAATAYSTIISTYAFYDSGTTTGSYAGLVDYTKDGIGAPSTLKTALLAQEANVPVGGFFQTTINGNTAVLAFYIQKN